MPTTIEISGWLEEQLERLVEIGLYSTKSEAVRDAIRRFLESIDMSSIALKLYRNRNISLGLAAEIADKTYEEMLTYMVTKGVIPELGEPDINMLLKQYEILMSSQGSNLPFIVDYSALSLMYYTDLIDYLDKLHNSIFYIPSQLIYSLRLLDIKRIVLYKAKSNTKIFNIKSLNKRINTSSVKRLGLTIYEYEALQLAKSLNLILLSEDMRIREKAKNDNIKAASTLALILYMRDAGILDKSIITNIIERAKSYPIIVPLELEI